MIDVRSALRRAAAFNRDLVAVVSGGRDYTFGEAWSRGLRLANGLAALGLQPGDRVAVLEDNTIEASDFLLGAAAGNFVRVPLYRRNGRAAHGHMVRHTGCRAIVVAAEYAHEVEGLDDEIETLEHVITRDQDYERWLAGFPEVDPDPPVSLRDVYAIRHSAGTSGQPKGIAYTHHAWMSTTRDWFYMLPPMQVGDACLHAGPISHGSGHFFLPLWLAGGRSLLDPRFDLQRTLQLLEDGDVSYLFTVPTMLADLVEAAAGPSRRSFPALKAILVSGAPIGRQTALQAHRLFGETLYQMYGQTEAVPATFMGPREWFDASATGGDRILSAGRVMPFAELEIRDERNQPVPTGSPGTIAVRCDGQMSGIWNDPEQTAERLVDGWVLTGDIGHLDEHGFLYVLDRADDMIVSGGFNIWPAELENVILELPGVREACVVAVPNARWGETPLALVVVGEGNELTEEDVRRACRDRLGSYKKPTHVVIQTDLLPRSPVGKIQRKVIRAPYWEGRERFVGGD